MNQKLPVDSAVVQSIVSRHYEWLGHFWTPTPVAYRGHSQLVIESELRGAYAAFDSRLPEFAGTAMKVFAEQMV